MCVAIREIRTAFNKKAFVLEAQRFLPQLSQDDVIVGGRGVRTQAMDRHGNLVEGFFISQNGRFAQVLSAPSTVATVSMAIAEHVVRTAASSASISIAELK
jgi:L-2-hydroxyglutarate oxidase